MKHLAAGLVLCAATAALSGCYVDPGYSYVRQTPYQGDVYYGQGTRVYDDGYYVAPVYPAYGYPAYGYGCCYAPGVSVGISGTWYSGPRYRYDRRGYRGDYRGSWRGHSSNRGDSHHDRRRDSDRDGHQDH